MSRLALVGLALLSLSGAPRTSSSREPQRRIEPQRQTWVAPRGMALALFEEAFVRRRLAWPPDPCELSVRGANTVLLPVLVEQWGLRADELERSREGVSFEDLRGVIGRARECGLQVAVVSLVEVRGGSPGAWRGRIRPAHPDRWWSSYRAFVFRLAEISEEEGVAALFVSHELSSLSSSRDAPRWRSLVRETRARFGGAIGVTVNHDALDAQLPWGAFDVIGVSAYFPLSGDLDAPEEELRAGWARAAARLRDFSARTQRRIVLTEVGYASIDGAATMPWDPTLGAPIDLEEQRRAYAAAIDTIDATPSIEGAIFWAWGGPGGRWDRTYTPRGKPAEVELRRFFGRGAPARSEGPSECARPCRSRSHAARRSVSRAR